MTTQPSLDSPSPRFRWLCKPADSRTSATCGSLPSRPSAGCGAAVRHQPIGSINNANCAGIFVIDPSMIGSHTGRSPASWQQSLGGIEQPLVLTVGSMQGCQVSPCGASVVIPLPTERPTCATYRSHLGFGWVGFAVVFAALGSYHFWVSTQATPPFEFRPRPITQIPGCKSRCKLPE